MVFHASTNPEVLAENITLSAAELVLEQRFVDYWTSFAITGNPNSGPLLFSFQYTRLHSFHNCCAVLCDQICNPSSGLCGIPSLVKPFCCKHHLLC